MTKRSFKSKLANLPVPILATMVGTATLSNLWAPLGFSWIRHIVMWASAFAILGRSFSTSILLKRNIQIQCLLLYMLVSL